jgi:3'-5' exoribonuclease
VGSLFVAGRCAKIAAMPIVALAELTAGQEADFFALLSRKEELATREGKPYWRVTFRDARRQVNFPVWDNSPWAVECRQRWTPGVFYKLRAVYRETNYGPQLEIRKIREVADADAADGFDPALCLPQSRFEPRAMYDELLALAREKIAAGPLLRLVESILAAHEAALLRLPAARRNHHAYMGGWLEHTLSVTRTASFLAEKYGQLYPDLQPPLDQALVVAGAILHDIGKLRELDPQPELANYTAEGELVGHILLGRDIVREASVGVPLPADTLLRLEHLILAHQRLPEWGSPKPPMTPEALLVHYADDADAKFAIMAGILRDDATPGVVTSEKNLLRQKVYRGGQ